MMERLTERILHDLVVVLPECKECRGDCGNCKYLDKALYKLKNYEDLEEQGLLLKLPCKVGDTVYTTRWWDIVKEKVEIDGEIYYRDVKKHIIIKEKFSLYDYEGLGKSVFLTKEEAEAKLKELENE